LVLVAACSSDEQATSTRLGQFALEQLRPSEPAPEPVTVTRAQLNQIPFATISLAIQESPPAFVVPLADNGGYLTYMDQTRRGIVMQGGAVVGTLGFGIDLNGVRSAANDPVAQPTPLSRWPGQVYRSYQYLQRDGPEYTISLTCVFERVARERIEIVEISYDVVRVAETCTNRARQVVNQYWVEEETGFIWRSIQWASPQIPPLTVEIIRPYARG
ncbi:MAG: YjbF family lipoprotein, partial [Pseudomonadota bacterium]